MNHWNTSGDLVVEQKTLFRQVGWHGHSGRFYRKEADPSKTEPSGFSPVYVQISTWIEGEGWDD